MALKAKLVVAFGLVEKCYELDDREVCMIGRTGSNTIQLSGKDVSRNHAVVQGNDCSVFHIYDLGSRNGTYVNGCRITAPAPLQDGDVISIGGLNLRFVQSVVPAEPESSALALPETSFSLTLKAITVLVTDIRGYTALCQQIGAARVAKIMQTFNSEAGKALARLDVWGVKYIGDAVMALWVHQGPPKQFLISGLRAISALLQIAESLQPRFGLASPVLLGAAMNTGTACIGNMGSNAAADYTALGDVVNRVFRLEASTRDLQADVVISSYVYNELRSEIDPENSMTAHGVQLKGYPELNFVYAMDRQTLRRALENLGPQVAIKIHKG